MQALHAHLRRMLNKRNVEKARDENKHIDQATHMDESGEKPVAYGFVHDQTEGTNKK